MPLGRSPPCYRWQTHNARPRNPFRLFCYASFRSRSITTTNICKNAEAFMTRGACDQRDCLTDPSPGPPESARQISSTCSPKFVRDSLMYCFEHGSQIGRVRRQISGRREDLCLSGCSRLAVSRRPLRTPSRGDGDIRLRVLRRGRQRRDYTFAERIATD